MLTAIVPIEINQQKQVAFIAAASHELKAPLAVIQSNASILEGMDHPTQHKFTNAIGQYALISLGTETQVPGLGTSPIFPSMLHETPE